MAHAGERRNACRDLVIKYEGRRLLGRPRHRREGNIEIDLKETEWEGMDWISFAQARGKWWALVNTLIKLLVP